ncbi:type II secretory pathway predicted ATPase ExeA [Sphingobium sp. B11D3B]|uniref:TniB family NTP-binding protein n=1 Tax=Sphingobium sp. B11D3B TaxID=2940575 RepID=UPI002225EC0E|nr:TniB family NTP-binding protein [Sphingobium sp. B11D3B]MCW2390059.1 type II secretory pathway predicted ATPase ExeA [Sphingobium sp. B11D3B]
MSKLLKSAIKTPKGAVKVIATFCPAELKPATGTAGREVTLEQLKATAAAIGKVNDIYLQHPAHREIFSRIDFLRELGASSNGMTRAVRVTGPSFAGKSTALAQYGQILERRGQMKDGRKTVVYVSLDRACTTKRLIASCLEAYGDEYSDRAVEGVLRQRLYKCIARFQTEVLMIDEIQHMDFRSSERDDATDMLKRFLDDRKASLVLAGNENARAFLESNVQLSNRMVTPCDINPLDRRNSADAKVFRDFIKRLDDQIVSAGVMPEPSNLTDRRILLCAHEVSQGLLGRAKNLVRVALENALNRGATRMEPHDFAVATREWAMPLKIISYNPFVSGIRTSAADYREASDV